MRVVDELLSKYSAAAVLRLIVFSDRAIFIFMEDFKMKKLTALLLSLILLLSLTACGAKTEAPAEAAPAAEAPVEAPAEEAPVEEAPAAEEAAWPCTIVDLLGNEIVLEAPVKSVVGTHNPTMNLAVVLGGGGKYIGGFGNKEMADTLYSYVFPELAEDVVQIGKGKNINFETVASLGCDLCILPERQKGLAADYANAGLPVAIVLSSTESFEAVRGSIALMGSILDEDERAAKINDTIISIEDAVTNATAAVAEEDKPTVLFLGSSAMYSVATDSMIQTEIMTKAGAKNAVTDLTVYGDFAEVTAEEILGYNPEVIWIPNYASYTVEDVMNDDAFKGTDAVKNGQVFVFPCELEPWDYPTATCVLGLAWAAQNLHGDLYSAETMKGACDELYGVIYGRTFTMEEMGLAE